MTINFSYLKQQCEWRLYSRNFRIIKHVSGIHRAPKIILLWILTGTRFPWPHTFINVLYVLKEFTLLGVNVLYFKQKEWRKPKLSWHSKSLCLIHTIWKQPESIQNTGPTWRHKHMFATFARSFLHLFTK